MNLKRTSWWVVLAVFVAAILTVWLVGRWLLDQFLAMHGSRS